MKLINLKSGNGYGIGIGIVSDTHVIDVAVAAQALNLSAPATMQALIARQHGGLAALENLAEQAMVKEIAMLPLESAQPGPAAPSPGKIICVGLNYRSHAAESGMDIPAEPILFSKFSNSIAASGQEIDVTGLVQLDYEAELGVVISKQAKNIPTEQALDYVLGYCNANDLSERALQFKSGQWLLGKTLDGFLPNGPFLRTPEPGFDPQNLDVRGWLNGELRQDSNTSDMIFSIPELISYISTYMTLEPGDLIITGTPQGVILGLEDKQWMKPGDEYTVEISGLGRLSNRLVSSVRQA